MRVLALLVFSALLGVGLVAGAMALGSGGETAKVARVQHVTMRIMPGDHMIGSNLLVHPGRVELTIVNTARHAHTFSVPALGIDRVLLPGASSEPSTTTVRFRVGSTGVYDWFCKLPCKRSMSGDIYFLNHLPHLQGPLWASA